MNTFSKDVVTLVQWRSKPKLAMHFFKKYAFLRNLEYRPKYRPNINNEARTKQRAKI